MVTITGSEALEARAARFVLAADRPYRIELVACGERGASKKKTADERKELCHGRIIPNSALRRKQKASTWKQFT